MRRSVRAALLIVFRLWLLPVGPATSCGSRDLAFLPTTARIRNVAFPTFLDSVPRPRRPVATKCAIYAGTLASLPQEPRPLEAWTEVALGRNFGRKCNLCPVFFVCVCVCTCA